MTLGKYSHYQKSYKGESQHKQRKFTKEHLGIEQNIMTVQRRQLSGNAHTQLYINCSNCCKRKDADVSSQSSRSEWLNCLGPAGNHTAGIPLPWIEALWLHTEEQKKKKL